MSSEGDYNSRGTFRSAELKGPDHGPGERYRHLARTDTQKWSIQLSSRLSHPVEDGNDVRQTLCSGIKTV